jgi:DNA-binding transcriptional MerR regulator
MTETACTIGQTAALASCTPDAIRYYEREGVLPAAERVGAGRHRMARTNLAQMQAKLA